MRQRKQEGHPRQQKNLKRASHIEIQPKKAGLLSLPTGAQIPGSLAQGPSNLSNARKKLRSDVGFEFQLHNPQPKYTTSDEGLMHQQLEHSLQPKAKMQQGQFQNCQWVVANAQRQKMQYVVNHCTQLLLNYMHHQRQRPSDNSISYWREFVANYYDPHAKKRWCNANSIIGVSRNQTSGAWRCNLCGSGPGKGIEAVFQTFPGLQKVKFDTGVIDEFLFVGFPTVYRLSFGNILLDYENAVQRTVYEQFHVVREGKLRVVFTDKLKILSWEFCTYRCEEFFPRSLLNHLVNLSAEVSEIDAEIEADGNPIDNSQKKCSDMLLDDILHSADKLVSSTTNNTGFSKSYYRCYKMSEVVDTMKDLIDFSKQHKLGPIEKSKDTEDEGDGKKKAFKGDRWA